MPDLSPEWIDARITFLEDDQIMEVCFEKLTLATSADVNAFYDRIEERIAASGEDLWFFLVDYRGTRIEPDAWFTFARRGKDLNTAHSMGSVRFDASKATLKQIERAANRDDFDPNLFYSRDDALAHLRSLPSKRSRFGKTRHKISFARKDLEKRIELLDGENIMFADFANMSFEHSADVDFVYDYLEEKLGETGRKWYFLVNYNGTQIQSPAWVRYAARGKSLNEEWSLGSVRYAAGSETEAEIRMRAESRGFRPNIRNTLDEALDRIREMKAEAVKG